MAVNLTTYVKKADLDHVVVATNDPLVAASIFAAGFTPYGDSGHYVIHADDDTGRAPRHNDRLLQTFQYLVSEIINKMLNTGHPSDSCLETLV